MELKDALKNSRKVMIGNELHIFAGVSDAVVEKAIQKGLKAGAAVVEAGVTRWITEDVIFDSSKPGSAAYIWNKDGERVRVKKFLSTKADGKTIRKEIGFGWRSW